MAGVYFGIIPEWASIKDKNAQIQEIDAATTIAKNQRDELESAILSYKKLDRSIKDRVIAALPTNTDTPNVLTILDRVVADSGLAISKISLQDTREKTTRTSAAPLQQQSETPQDGLKNIIFGVSATGDYISIKRLVLSLENLLRLNDIDSFTVVHVKEEGKGKEGPPFRDANLLEIELQGTMYSLP